MAFDWTGLIAGSAEGRRAIYSEQFPGRWADLKADLGGPGALDFTEHEASQLLTVFATHWEHLPPTEHTDEICYHLVVLQVPIPSAHVAVAFVARQLRPDQIVVAYPTPVRDL
ncbi:MAG: hypothetical protein R2761_18405 [Acidimicrobiales bacterium]